jgi:hypothetical protein
LKGQRFDLRVEGKGTGPFSATLAIDGRLVPFTSGEQGTTTTDKLPADLLAGWHLPAGAAGAIDPARDTLAAFQGAGFTYVEDATQLDAVRSSSASSGPASSWCAPRSPRRSTSCGTGRTPRRSGWGAGHEPGIAQGRLTGRRPLFDLRSQLLAPGSRRH